MKSHRTKSGFTLVEMLIVITVIIVLAAMVITAGKGLFESGKKKLTESTLAILVSALEEYNQYAYRYPNPHSNYRKLTYPLDCTGVNNPAGILSDALFASVNINPSGNREPEYSSTEVMYFFLNKISNSQKILKKIDPSLVINKDKNSNPMTITVDGLSYPLFRVIDPWGTPLEYDYYNETLYDTNPDNLNDMLKTRRNFPLIRSAGPDKVYRTADDILSR